ncbi:MAG TPA: phosphatidylserine/phosphatidylglycerophosphate/cardiolipin synthase family protein [Gemmatimonadaceae bacterium]|jgi:phosphatidylserine/phosphatidylglycerophosphate/cardiolipin synthase-like enzyme
MSKPQSGAIPFVETGPYATRAGNAVTPLIDGGPAFRRICEAIESARESVWVTVTFMWSSFEMPDGRGSALDVLERAAKRGVDVRIIFWRPGDELSMLRRHAFWGSAEHFALLAERYQHINIRWDRAQTGYCQHQKTWMIDGATDDATAFVGGINLNPHSVAEPGHRGTQQNHDVYVELQGPSVADVHHNFVQRWNGATDRELVDGRWGDASASQLSDRDRAPSAKGDARAQIQRTMPDERTNLDQYVAAIASARRTIYIENQYIDVRAIVDALDGALARGVSVTALLPSVPEVLIDSRSAEGRALGDARAALAKYEHFTFCGLFGMSDDEQRSPVYVHSKLMLVDDHWATVGSCNLHHYSLMGNAELNVAFDDAASVRAIRVALFSEHLGLDTSAMDDCTAHALFKSTAEANRALHAAGRTDWQGLAITLDPSTYAATQR